MLQGLKINNIAVIENAELEFDKGLNILTGETGAGKSIVIDSINAVLGERTPRDLVRQGTDSAKVTAIFTDVNDEVKALLEESGIECNDDDSVVISRQISLNGKNSCRVNGIPVSVSLLKEIGSGLINIHGQHDSQALMNPDKHCSFIDSMAENDDLMSSYKKSFSELISIKHRLDSLYDLRDEKASRLDYLDFVIKEISDNEIRAGESEQLNKEKTMLQNGARVKKSLEKAYFALSGDNGLAESLMECSNELQNASKYYDDAVKTADAVKNMAFELEEYTAEARNLLDKFNYSPERLTQIDDRLDTIYRLSAKYGRTEEDIINTLNQAIAERNEIVLSDEKITVLENELYKASDVVKTNAEKLSASRKKAAVEFEKSVTEELAFLDMPYVVFKVDIKSVPLSSKGAEIVEFLISTNPGQEPKPISKIASGGELSRIMLAIKNVLSGKDIVDTLIFDEIDTGVSGSAAEKIALKLYSVSKGRQVICVTHLARIAAQADNHMKIEKSVIDNKTFTKVFSLDFDSRAAEIARITAGTGITGLQIDSAKEMLLKAKENSI